MIEFYYSRLKRKMLFNFPNISISFPRYSDHDLGKEIEILEKRSNIFGFSLP